MSEGDAKPETAIASQKALKFLELKRAPEREDRGESR